MKILSVIVLHALCNAVGGTTVDESAMRSHSRVKQDSIGGPSLWTFFMSSKRHRRGLSIADATDSTAKKPMAGTNATTPVATTVPASTGTSATSFSDSSISGMPTTTATTMTGGKRNSAVTSESASNSTVMNSKGFEKDTQSSSNAPTKTVSASNSTKTKSTKAAIKNTSGGGRSTSDSENTDDWGSSDDTSGTDDKSEANKTYPLNHYQSIQDQYNSSVALPWARSTPFEKNLSTTKTPFLPSEHSQPEMWPRLIGGVFLFLALVLILATVVRNYRATNQRRNYEEIQSLIV